MPNYIILLVLASRPVVRVVPPYTNGLIHFQAVALAGCEIKVVHILTVKQNSKSSFVSGDSRDHFWVAV